MKKKKNEISWRLVYDAIQDYLSGEHGSPTMQRPHKDLGNNLVFTDCDGHKFGLDGLIKWYESLADDGEIDDELGLLDGNIDVIDDRGKIVVIDDDDEEDED
jgi:hypothetical protein